MNKAAAFSFPMLYRIVSLCLVAPIAYVMYVVISFEEVTPKLSSIEAISKIVWLSLSAAMLLAPAIFPKTLTFNIGGSVLVVTSGAIIGTANSELIYAEAMLLKDSVAESGAAAVGEFFKTLINVDSFMNPIFPPETQLNVNTIVTYGGVYIFALSVVAEAINTKRFVFGKIFYIIASVFIAITLLFGFGVTITPVKTISEVSTLSIYITLASALLLVFLFIEYARSSIIGIIAQGIVLLVNIYVIIACFVPSIDFMNIATENSSGLVGVHSSIAAPLLGAIVIGSISKAVSA